MTITQLTKIAEQRLGSPNRILTVDKGGYLEKHPNNVIAFDVNVIIGGYIVWSGDIDITDQIGDIQDLAKDAQNSVRVCHKLSEFFKKSEAKLPPPLLIADEYKIISLYGNGKIRFIQDGIPYVKTNDIDEN